MSGSSGDLLADRRYQWGAGALKEKDFASAADLLRQAIEIAPLWAPAHLALGDALAGLGDAPGARAAWGEAGRLDPSGVLGADLKIAALAGARAPAAPPRDYVRALFDEYAPRFDAHLRGALAYRGPELLIDAIGRACTATGRPFHFARALDLGCGSGLMAAALRAYADTMDGCDLSPKMIELARRTGAYARLRAADVVEYLQDESDGAADLVVAADVFVYLGDLSPVFAQSARVLRRGGLFAFTVQRGGDDVEDWALGADLRYVHSRACLQRLAEAHGFAATLIEDASTRRDAGQDVPGLVCALVRS